MEFDLSKYTDLTYDYIKLNLSEEEGIRNAEYEDTKGLKTIGIGHLIQDKYSLEKLIGHVYIGHISNAEIDLIFKHDLQKTFISIQEILHINLKDYPKNVQYVILSLAFNLGGTGLSKFVNFLAFIKENEYDYAARELQNSLWFKQVGLRGARLVNML